MQPDMRRRLPGPWAARRVAPGSWRLSRTNPAPMEVFVRGVDATDDAFPAGLIDGLDIDWRADGVEVRIEASGVESRRFAARSVIVHEPLPGLYESLPLVSLAAGSRRFWRRVFALARMPGGRLLLGWVARRSRARG